jgi:hypothetical protein
MPILVVLNCNVDCNLIAIRDCNCSNLQSMIAIFDKFDIKIAKFDCNFDILCHKICKLGENLTAISWFQSILCHKNWLQTKIAIELIAICCQNCNRYQISVGLIEIASKKLQSRDCNVAKTSIRRSKIGFAPNFGLLSIYWSTKRHPRNWGFTSFLTSKGTVWDHPEYLQKCHREGISLILTSFRLTFGSFDCHF